MTSFIPEYLIWDKVLLGEEKKDSIKEEKKLNKIDGLAMKISSLTPPPQKFFGLGFLDVLEEGIVTLF